MFKLMFGLFASVLSFSVVACPTDSLVSEVAKARPLEGGNQPELSILIVDRSIKPTTLVMRDSDGRVSHIAYVASRHDPPCAARPLVK
jgi:hypothetical protein